MPVHPPFDEVKFLAPLRAAMHGWATADEAGLWDRIRAADEVVREMEAKKRFIFGNSTHLKALREVSALYLRASEFGFCQIDAYNAAAERRCCALETGRDYVTQRSDGTIVQYTVRKVEQGFVSIRYEDGALTSFALRSPLHEASLPIAA